MRLAYGATRWVILTRHLVVKFARFHFFNLAKRFIWRAVRGEVRQRLLLHGSSPSAGAIQILLAGCRANWQEYTLWRDTHDARFVPTLFSLFGLVNVQHQAKALTAEEFRDRNPFGRLIFVLPERATVDLKKLEHYGWYGGRIRLVDYGHDAMTEFFSPRRHLSIQLQASARP